MSTLTAISASLARARLYPLIDAVAEDGPIQVIGRRGTAVLVGLDEWNAIQETLHLASQPVVMAKVRAGSKEARSRLRSLDQIK
jgi:prevent-host-death family protein